MSALCVVVLNRKGGVGKTSTCFHLSGTLARMGRRVLLVDCDPQANLSEGLLGAQVEGLPPDRTIAALYGDAFLPEPRALIVPTPIEGVDLLPGSEAMEDYSEPRPAGHRSQGVLREFVDEVRGDYGVILLDCPPSLTLASWSAMVAADGVLVPVMPEDFGAQGLKKINRALALVLRRGEPVAPAPRHPGEPVQSEAGDPRRLRRSASGRLRRIGLRRHDPDRRRLQAGGHGRQAGRPAQAPVGRRESDGGAGRGAAGPGRRRRDAKGGGVMSLKDTLTARLGDRMRASMGAGEGPSADPAPAGPPGTTRGAAGKTDGLKALRTAALIPIDRLTPDPDQPRKTFSDEEIDRLADSLRSRGMLQPIRARWDQDLARWVIVAGERRFRAARRAGWTEVPCVTVDAPLTASEVRMDQIIENCLRENLAPLEQATAFQALMDANGWSARRLAEELHISHQTVIRAVGLLELPAEVRDRVESGELSPRAAAEIATLERPEDQRVVADHAVSGALNRDQVADVVKARKTGKGGGPPGTTRADIRLDGGRKVVLSGLPDDRPESVVAALREALRQAQARVRDAARGDEKAA